ncbi:hypothetical protein F4861DRAFT_166724 [Xylaria intraflava]|nr:hypothetical protein F4861DRAFT_166724 [Xylaria intraflava]
MSSRQPKSSLARTQPQRAPPKSTLTAPQTSASPITKSAQVPVRTSNVNLFLTNLRLLELDLEPDWPDITLTTLSAKDAAGGQKKRVQCVEWALYRLFSLWDHADTQNKLRPFYPPADQVQSINLRAALVRCLEAVKKSGVLGRDVLIRKTMLDECKGERLEEVLAVFSSVVLKKLVAERALNSGPEYRPSISESISLETRGYKSDRTELNGLLLAHKASLRSILEKKNAARQKYRDFEELLAMKERRIARRQEQVKANAQRETTTISDAVKTDIRRILRNNWAGNEHWLDGLLLGDRSSQKGGLLNTPFDDIWSGVKAGSISDFEDQTAGLLEQLDKRVRRQQTRLQTWKAFRQSTFGDIQPQVTHDPLPEGEKNDIGFDFTAHLHLDFATNDIKFDNPPSEYTKFLGELTTELEDLKATKIPNFQSLITGVRRVPTSAVSQFVPQAEPAAETVSDLSDWEDEPEAALPLPKVRESSTISGARPTAIPGGVAGYKRQLPRIKISSGDYQMNQFHRESAVKPLVEPRRSQANARTVQAEYEPDPMGDNESDFISRTEERKSSYSSSNQLECPETANSAVRSAARSKSPTQALADEILTSMNNASPSPVKKSRYTLSLAERARMSMARKASFEREDELPQLSPVDTNHAQENGSHTTESDLERGEEYEDLITRTRRSMAGFEAARQKAQLERRRSQRKSRAAQRKDSYFPGDDEDGVGDLSVLEGLMDEGQEDYETVFKSRPRIANSPAPGPKAQ